MTDFQKGILVDSEIKKLWLEGLGGGNGKESYLEAMLFFASPQIVDFPLMVPGTKPFFFITGDEGLYEKVDASSVHKLMGPGDYGVPSTGGVTVSFMVISNDSLSLI